MATSSIQLLDALASNRIRLFSSNVGGNKDTVQITLPQTSGNSYVCGFILSRFGIAAFTITQGSSGIIEATCEKLTGSSSMTFTVTYSGHTASIKGYYDWDNPIVILGSPYNDPDFYNNITVAFSHS